MRKVFVVGSPVRHSLSPAIHNAAYQHLGLDYQFRIQEVSVENLSNFWQELPEDTAGLAVTSPLKHQVISYLDAVEPMAATLGVVNTVVYNASLKTGLNTDVYGIKTALIENPHYVKHFEKSPNPVSVAIIGSGATAISAIMACAELGHREVSLVARSFHKPPSAVKIAHLLGITPQIIPLSQTQLVNKTLNAAQIIISTIPGKNLSEIRGNWGKNPGQPLLLEADYANSQAATEASIKSVGGAYIPGTRMLLHQATLQFNLITGVEAPVEVMENALNQALLKRG